MPRKALAIIIPILVVVVALAFLGPWGGFWATTETGPRDTVGIDRAEPGYTPNTSRPPATSSQPPSRIDPAAGQVNPVPSGTGAPSPTD